jgi:hypothetical protein
MPASARRFYLSLSPKPPDLEPKALRAIAATLTIGQAGSSLLADVLDQPQRRWSLGQRRGGNDPKLLQDLLDDLAEPVFLPDGLVIALEKPKGDVFHPVRKLERLASLAPFVGLLSAARRAVLGTAATRGWLKPILAIRATAQLSHFVILFVTGNEMFLLSHRMGVRSGAERFVASVAIQGRTTVYHLRIGAARVIAHRP